MSRERTIKVDPFVAFLIAYIDCSTVYEAAKKIGMRPQRLNTYATRGLRSIPAMTKLAEDFGIPISVVGQWISENIEILSMPCAETDLIEIAS